MSYRHLMNFISGLFGALSLTLIFVPALVYWLFQIHGNEVADFLAKRSAALFIGLSILCFYARNSSAAEVRRLVSLSVGSAMSVMAVLGIYEFIKGTVGAGIFVAIAIEITVVLLILSHHVKHSNLR